MYKEKNDNQYLPIQARLGRSPMIWGIRPQDPLILGDEYVVIKL